MVIFRAVWEGNAVELEDFLYRDEEDQLRKIDKQMQAILYEIEGIKNGTKKPPMPNIKLHEKEILSEA